MRSAQLRWRRRRRRLPTVADALWRGVQGSGGSGGGGGDWKGEWVVGRGIVHTVRRGRGVRRRGRRGAAWRRTLVTRALTKAAAVAPGSQTRVRKQWGGRRRNGTSSVRPRPRRAGGLLPPPPPPHRQPPPRGGRPSSCRTLPMANGAGACPRRPAHVLERPRRWHRPSRRRRRGGSPRPPPSRHTAETAAPAPSPPASAWARPCKPASSARPPPLTCQPPPSKCSPASGEEDAQQSPAVTGRRRRARTALCRWVGGALRRRKGEV